MRTNRRTFPAAEIIPRSYLEPLDLAAIFGRNAPVEVDLGCGDGRFLVALAQQKPEVNFIGIERMAGRVRSACRKIGSLGLTNVRVMEHDILHAVQQLFARETVGVFHLLFSDPWPKRRHGNRRVVNAALLRAVMRALRANGVFHVATDHAEYFTHIHNEITRISALLTEDASALRAMPTTTFEERFRRNGLAIHRLLLRKVSAPR